MTLTASPRLIGWDSPQMTGSSSSLVHDHLSNLLGGFQFHPQNYHSLLTREAQPDQTL